VPKADYEVHKINSKIKKTKRPEMPTTKEIISFHPPD
jgi:hypothetical protein